MPAGKKSASSRKKHAPVYCFLGEDVFRKLEALREIRDSLLADRDQTLNYEYLIASEVTPARILDSARSVSWGLFDSANESIKRLVVVDEAETITPTEWKLLADYIKNPSDSSCLIFLVNRSAREWSRKKIFPSGAVKDFRPYRGKTLSNWSKAQAQKRGLVISRPVLEELIRLSGGDSGTIVQELDKLELYLSPEKTVLIEHVRELTAGGPKGNIFKLTEYIVSGKKDDALILLNLLLAEGERPLRILGFLVNSFRRLWLGREIWDETGDGGLVARKCGIRYYKDDFIEQVKNVPSPRIPYIWRLLLEANTALKGGEKSARNTLERMIIRMAGPGAGPDRRAQFH